MKVIDIKVIRSLSILLGKLGLSSCFTSYPTAIHPFEGDSYLGTRIVEQKIYGIDLNIIIDFCNSNYDYSGAKATALVPVTIPESTHKCK